MRWWAWIIPVAAAAAIYVPCLEGDLVWDDGIVQKDQLVAFRLDKPRDIFFFRKDIPQWSPAYYRPMVTISYLIDQWAFGRFDNPNAPAAWRSLANVLPGNGPAKGHHASVVLLHVLTTFFVWAFARQVLSYARFREWAALLAGVVFAVHPIHTESVCWLTGRSDTLATMFVMASLVVAMSYRDTDSPAVRIFALVVAPLLLLAGLLSKEVALAGMLLLPALYMFVPRRGTARLHPAARADERTQGEGGVVFTPGELSEAAAVDYAMNPEAPANSRFRRFLWLLPMVALYGAMVGVYFLLRSQAAMSYGQSVPGTFGEQAQRVIQALGYYLVKVVWPIPQNAFLTDLPPLWLSSIAVGVGVVLLAVGTWLAWRGAPTLFISLGWFFLAVAPSIAIVLNTIAKNPVAERYLYLPSVAVSLLAGGMFAAGLNRAAWRIPAILFALAISGGYAWLAWERVPVWKNDITLWSDVIKSDPKGGVPWLSLGNAYKDQGQPDKALEHLKIAVERYETNAGKAIAENSIGTIYMGRGEFKEAAAAFMRAIQVNPRYATPWFNMGVMGMQSFDRQARTMERDKLLTLLQGARQAFGNAVRLNPTYTRAYLEFGKCLLRFGQFHLQSGGPDKTRPTLVEAQQRFEKVVSLDPNSPFADEARRHLETVKRMLAGLPASQPAATGPVHTHDTPP